MTSTNDTKRFEELRELVKVLRYKMEADQNAYFEAQATYRNTQLQYDKAVIEMNWLREKLASSSSV
jgi:hypothetical protein